MSGIVGMKSSKQFELPTWAPDYIGKVDLRCSLGVRVVRRMEALAEDITNGDGERLSYRQWSLCCRAAWLEERISHEEMKIMDGTPGQPGAHSTLLNCLNGIYRTLTQVGPKERNVISLKDYIKSVQES